MIKEIFAILLSALLTENFVMVKFYGICPFLGVSKKTDTAVGMGDGAQHGLQAADRLADVVGSICHTRFTSLSCMPLFSVRPGNWTKRVEWAWRRSCCMPASFWRVWLSGMPVGGSPDAR